ncbi:MAG TPA: hypothetical protein VJ023_13485, partial [Pyrinomonadaceae bacterium]|nr:hypothetical protein [Pyrinomonadaceae bacterium]
AALIVLLDEIEKTALREPFAVEPITVLVKSRAYYRSQSTEKLQDALIKKLRADLAATTKSK